MIDPSSIEPAVMAELQRQADADNMYAPWFDVMHSISSTVGHLIVKIDGDLDVTALIAAVDEARRDEVDG
jgi:hypothetical protein